MPKNLTDLLGGYSPKPEGEKKFVNKHTVNKHADRNGNDDALFKAAKIKTLNRASERHGYDVGADEKVYEGKSLAEVLNPSMGAGEYIKDFEKSKNPKFAGKSKEQRKKQALAAYYSAKNEESEIDEGVVEDSYNEHHKRAMKATENIAKHLMKHKSLCDKSDNKWSHSDGLWRIKDLSRQLEDMAQNIATDNENTENRNKGYV